MKSLAPLAVALAALAYAPLAAADALPPTDCDISSLGSSCDTAGPTFNATGLCVAEPCPHAAFGPDAGAPGANDAGPVCAVCELPFRLALDGGSVDATFGKVGPDADVAGGDSGSKAAARDSGASSPNDGVGLHSPGGQVSPVSSGGCAIGRVGRIAPVPSGAPRGAVLGFGLLALVSSRRRRP